MKLLLVDGRDESGVMVEAMTCQESAAGGEGLRFLSPKPSSGESGRCAKLKGCGDGCDGRSKTMREGAAGSEMSRGGVGRLDERPVRDCGRWRSSGGGTKLSGRDGRVRRELSAE